MSKSLNLKLSIRLNERCKDVVEQVASNQLTLYSKDKADHKKFQVDRMYMALYFSYSPTDNNEKLFENLLSTSSNFMIEGFSSLVFCLGSPGSGKTYSLAGKFYQNKEPEPGIMVYMMRRLYSKFKHEVSLYSTYSFWCRFLFVEKGRITNLQGEVKESDPDKMQKLIEIENYSHFEKLISEFYSNNNNKCHTIVQLILQKETQNQETVTSSVTFVEFGSFFYNCPYREVEKESMENQIETTIQAIKNLEKKKTKANLFDTCLLTKLLKNTILKSSSFEFLGFLDDSFENNLKTLNFLEILMHEKMSYLYSKNAKEEIKREQALLKGLYQKHRKVLNMLSRCIGMELGYLEKEKKKNFDGPILNTFSKTCQKIKYANQKKLQNEKMLEDIKKEIDFENTQLNEINGQYMLKFEKLESEKEEILAQKRELQAIYESTINPDIKFSNTDNSLFCKLEEAEEKCFKRYVMEDDQKPLTLTYPVDTERDSRIETKSYKILYSTNHQISNRKNMDLETEKTGKPTHRNEKYQRDNQYEMVELGARRLKQIKWEIGQIYSKIVGQNLEIERQKKRIPLNSRSALVCIKTNHECKDFQLRKAQSCLMQTLHASQSDNYKYKQMLQNIRIQSKIEKDLGLNNNSLGAISMKSMKSQKLLKPKK